MALEGRILLISCRDATQLISKSLDTKLPFSKSIILKVHLLICKICTRYALQLRKMRSAFQTYQHLEGDHSAHLSSEARMRIQKKMDDEGGKYEPPK